MSYPESTIDRGALWRLQAAADTAVAQMCSAEAALAQADRMVHQMDAMLSRLRHLASQVGVPLQTPSRTGTASHDPMTVASFAKKMAWGEKRMRQLVRHHMVEGEHFHRNGRKVLVHPDPAAAFVEQFSVNSQTGPTKALPVVDEVTQFRARQARKRRQADER